MDCGGGEGGGEGCRVKMGHRDRCFWSGEGTGVAGRVEYDMDVSRLCGHG